MAFLFMALNRHRRPPRSHARCSRYRIERTRVAAFLQSEAGALASLISDLVDNHAALQGQLMAEEEITLELDRNPWWGCLEGDCHAWSLRLILSSANSESRGVEVFWPAPAAAAAAGPRRCPSARRCLALPPSTPASSSSP